MVSGEFPPETEFAGRFHPCPNSPLLAMHDLAHADGHFAARNWAQNPAYCTGGSRRTLAAQTTIGSTPSY
jgi:hypothetical protein